MEFFDNRCFKMFENNSLIAVVEDNEGLRSAIVQVLNSHGYKAFGFDSAESFLLDDCKNSFDFLLTDYQMSALSGIDLVIKVTAMKLKCICILMSGNSNSNLHDEAIRAGCNFFISKPFSFDVLNELLLSCMTDHGVPE